MSTLYTHLTKHGYQTLMKKGLVPAIKFYQVLDNSHNYTVTANENLVLPATGSHTQITTSQCAFADYNGVFLNEPSQQEIKNETSKVQLNFVNQDCDYTYTQPNVSLNINLHSWIYQLQNLSYSFNMPGLSKDLWDFVTATVQTLNLTTKSYDNTFYTADLGISWVPKTEVDKNNMVLISPTYVNLEGSRRTLIDRRGSVRNGSPFFLSFSTYSVNGTPIHNTAAKIHLVTSKFGYWVNKSNFLSASEVENTDLNSYSSVYPAAMVGNSIYYLPTNKVFPTEEGFVGYALNMVKTDNSGETLITGLINQIILFTKTYFKQNNSGIYTMQINLNALVTNKNINFITEKIGGNATITFRFDPNNINNLEDIITLN